jgi:hypothetical protein
MSGVLGSLGGIFKTAAPALGGVTAGAGLIGNIINSITRGKQISNLESAENKFANLTPEKLAGLVSRAEQPLDASLVQNITNLTQADMASRGLSQAPGIFAAEESQTLAPYKLQEQQNALQLIMKQMGLPIEYADAILRSVGPNADISRILAMLMNQNNPAPGGGGGGGNQVPNTSGIPSSVPDIIISMITGGGGDADVNVPIGGGLD